MQLIPRYLKGISSSDLFTKQVYWQAHLWFIGVLFLLLPASVELMGKSPNGFQVFQCLSVPNTPPGLTLQLKATRTNQRNYLLQTEREIQSTSGGQNKSTYFKEALLDNEFTPSVNALKQLYTDHGEKETLEVVWTT